MIDAYAELPDMYRAELSPSGELLIIAVNAHIYRRIGTDNLAYTKSGAIELLRHRLMNVFTHQLKCVNWQALQFEGYWHRREDDY